MTAPASWRCLTGPRSHPSGLSLLRVSAAVAVSIAIAGCERPEVVGTRNLGLTRTTMTCTHTSFCMTCLPGFDGRMKCAPKLSPYCPGHKDAIGTLVEETLRYPSKPAETFTERRIINRQATGVCR